MKRSLSYALAASLAFGALLLVPREARACSCLPPPPPEVALERSAAVFVGEVLAVTQKSQRARQVTLRVERAFKDAKGPELTLTTPIDSAACGRNFEVGKRYVVYAEDVQGGLYDHLCTRTAEVERAQHDLDALDALSRGERPPAEPKPAVDEEGGPETPPSGAADGDQPQPGQEPAHEEAPAPPTSPPGEPQPPGDAPAGHCAAVSGAVLPPVGLLVGLALVAARRRRR